MQWGQDSKSVFPTDMAMTPSGELWIVGYGSMEMDGQEGLEGSSMQSWAARFTTTLERLGTPTHVDATNLVKACH